MSTSFSQIYTAFFKRIENDWSFFNYYNITSEEAMALAKQRAEGYLIESITNLTSSCTPDVDFTDYVIDNIEDENSYINVDCTQNEINLLAQLMFEQYLNRDIVKLKAFVLKFSPSDLEHFSPANERKTFNDMFKDVQIQSEKMLDKYASRDRLTNKRKTINYNEYYE